jgi:glycosyltransferase involved in cell wall biosynthesis
MIIAVHSSYDARTIANNLGAPEYSYWFVRKAFTPLLEQFGLVVPVTDPAREVDAVRRGAAKQGMAAAYFSFDPPHKTVLGLGCPTIPVFAWEFDTIPAEVWDDEPRNDWTHVLDTTGVAITHCQSSVAAVRRRMGESYPIWSIPAPMHRASAHHAESARGWQNGVKLSISGGIAVDAGAVDLSHFDVRRAHMAGVQALQALKKYVAAPNRPPQTLVLNGVVYSAVFSPSDGRKNWTDLLAGFITAFRDNPFANLIIKITHHDVVDGLLNLLCHIAKFGDFKCRVVLIHGMLPDDEYKALIGATSYTVNTSTGEGQCLPLMEYMSAGRPAVAPAHTAMLDYVTPENSFVVRSSESPHAWPHDSRQATRCMHHRVSFTDLVKAYRESFGVAQWDPRRYADMSAAATQSLGRFCSDEVVLAKLTAVLNHVKEGSAESRATPRGKYVHAQ